jgi:hypothetical protein
VEDKPEVKKAGGVYYTPTYIVDYIVKNTVGKLLERKTPTKVAKIRVLDPACGSGSFLLGVYQYLLDWHQEWYAKHDPEKHAKGRSPKLYRTISPSPHGRGQGEGVWRLTTAEKKRILLNNIYGVDIDTQAVEVTKLSLLLKVLEGENAETLGKTFKLFHERALPDLGDNIKCGNSLIGPDFYEGKQLSLLDDEERYRINAFDWEAEFPEIMEAGGFDAVIGNPPWGAAFRSEEMDYLRRIYARVVDRMVDSYIYFLDRAVQAASKTGFIGFIVPGTILNQVEAQSVRNLLLQRGLRVLINLGQGVFGPRVLNTSAILISAPTTREGALEVDDLSRARGKERKISLMKLRSIKWETWKDLSMCDPHLTFFASDPAATLLLNRLRNELPNLRSTLAGGIQRGVTPDVVTAHVLSKDEVDTFGIEPDLLRPSITGSRVKRYGPCVSNQWILYTTRTTHIKQYPRTLEYLRRYRHLNTCKEVAEGKHPWWALHRPRDPQIFKSPKIIGLTTTKTIELVYDPDSSLHVTDAMYVFRVLPQYDPLALMAILQSRAFLFLYRTANQGESRVIPQVKASKLQLLPIPIVGCDGNAKSARLHGFAQRMLLLYQQLAAAKTSYEKTAIQRQIDATDKQINQLVYELYGLTKEEIKIVEEATK